MMATLAEVPRRVAPGFNHRQCGFRVANAAGGLDAELRADGFAHQLYIFHRRAAGAEAGGGFDEARPAFNHELAGVNFFLPGEQAGFEDDFHRPFVRRLHHVAQLAKNVFVIAVLEPAKVEDDINFLRAIVNGRLGFKTFHVARHGAQRKAHRAGDLDAGAFQKMAGLSDPGAIDADAVKIVFARLGAKFLDVFGGGIRLQQGVVNAGGQLRG